MHLVFPVNFRELIAIIEMIMPICDLFMKGENSIHDERRVKDGRRTRNEVDAGKVKAGVWTTKAKLRRGGLSVNSSLLMLQTPAYANEKLEEVA